MVATYLTGHPAFFDEDYTALITRRAPAVAAPRLLARSAAARPCACLREGHRGACGVVRSRACAPLADVPRRTALTPARPRRGSA